LKSGKEKKTIYERMAVTYPYTVADLKVPRFYRRSMKRMQIALGEKIESEDSKILDVGCGTAYFTSLLSKRFQQVVGIDLSRTMIKIGRRGLTHEEAGGKIQLVVGDGEHLPFRENSFSFVLCTDFLHHVTNVQLIIREMARVAVAGGKIVTTEPNMLSPWYAILCLIRREEESFKGFFECSMWRLAKFFKQSNLDNIRVREIDFYPQLFLKLRPFPEKLSMFLDYIEELARRQRVSFIFCSHFSIVGKKKER